MAKIEVWGDFGDFAVFLIYLYINSRSTTQWPVCYGLNMSEENTVLAPMPCEAPRKKQNIWKSDKLTEHLAGKHLSDLKPKIKIKTHNTIIAIY